MTKQAFESVYREIFPFWDRISEGDRAYICQNSYDITYPKGKNIHDGSECSGVILVRSGCIRLYIMSEEGRDITLYRLYKGDLCMLSASCVLDAITFDVFLDAEEDSQCCVIGGPAFAAVSQRNPDIRIFALETAVSRFSDVMWVMQQVLFMRSAREVVSRMLKYFANEGFVEVFRGGIHILDRKRLRDLTL